jgi:NAD(P)-dependent dehydrogenase (short-subunit alcohol dehydrogenase family)
MCAVYADEIEHTAVRIAVLNPGPMRTRMRAQAFPGEDPMTLPEPGEIVPLALDLLSADREPPQGVVSFPAWKAQQESAAVAGSAPGGPSVQS